jgi:transposase
MALWQDLPERFGKWNPVLQRFNRWDNKDSGKKCFEVLQEPDLDWLLIDSTLDHFRSNGAGSSACSASKKGAGKPMRF